MLIVVVAVVVVAVGMVVVSVPVPVDVAVAVVAVIAVVAVAPIGITVDAIIVPTAAYAHQLLGMFTDERRQRLYLGAAGGIDEPTPGNASDSITAQGVRTAIGGRAIEMQSHLAPLGSSLCSMCLQFLLLLLLLQLQLPLLLRRR